MSSPLFSAFKWFLLHISYSNSQYSSENNKMVLRSLFFLLHVLRIVFAQWGWDGFRGSLSHSSFSVSFFFIRWNILCQDCVTGYWASSMAMAQLSELSQYLKIVIEYEKNLTAMWTNFGFNVFPPVFWLLLLRLWLPHAWTWARTWTYL